MVKRPYTILAINVELGGGPSARARRARPDMSTLVENLLAILTANTILFLQRSNIYFHSPVIIPCESSGGPIGAGLAEVPATEGAVEPLEPTIRLSLAPNLAIGHI